MRSQLAENNQTIIFRQETCRFWEERTGDQVSMDDAAQAIANVTAFFDLLAKWDRQSHESEKGEHYCNEHDNSCSQEEN